MPLPPRLKAVIACPGVGRERRGFETFAEELFHALRGDDRVDLHLAKGGGRAGEAELRIPNTPRRSRVARMLGRFVGRSGYVAEQVTFVAGLVPHLMRLRPDVVFVVDWTVGSSLWRWRELTRSGFRILLSNGGSYSPPYTWFDHVQQLTELHRADAIAGGEPPGKHSVVPYGFFLRDVPVVGGRSGELRARLELPLDRPVAVSVGALELSVKRHDQVIRAVARSGERPFLVLLGQPEPETSRLDELAHSLLGPENYAIRTVQPSAVGPYYAASDVFVLASFREGFGRVFVEACAAGLPCIVNDFAVAREVLGEWGTYLDTADTAAFAASVDAEIERARNGHSLAEARHRAMVDRYDWGSLHERYVELFRRCVRPFTAD